MKKILFFLILFFSSSVYSQSGYFPGSTKDRIDDLEQQRMFDKLERGLDEIRRQNQELQRQQPQINPPIYSSPQSKSDLEAISTIHTDNVSGYTFIRKSSLKRQPNNSFAYTTETVYGNQLSFINQSNKNIIYNFAIESKIMNCNSFTTQATKLDFYLKECSNCINKKLMYTAYPKLKEKAFPIEKNSIEFEEYKYICR